MALVSIVIPAYNEEENLSLLYERLAAVGAQLQDVDLEFVIVDDASKDRTPEILKDLALRDARVRPQRFARNFGSHVACLAGLTCAAGDAMMIMSADLQDPPELIPQLVAKWRQGYEIVWAVRESREDPYRNILQARLFYWVFRRIAIRDFPEQGADVVLLSRRAAQAIVQAREKNTSLFGLIGWLGLKQTRVPYARQARHAGVSKWTFGKVVKHALDAFVSFSYFPIRAISYMGLLSLGAGGIMLATLLVLAFTGSATVTGWLWILCGLLVTGGIQGIMMGILGEYVWRTLEQVRQRPMFIMDQQTPDKIDERQ